VLVACLRVPVLLGAFGRSGCSSSRCTTLTPWGAWGGSGRRVLCGWGGLGDDLCWLWFVSIGGLGLFLCWVVGVGVFGLVERR
jgi:hypothetical protein